MEQKTDNENSKLLRFLMLLTEIKHSKRINSYYYGSYCAIS